MKDAISKGGGKYVSNDAKSSAETQASNVDNLISQGAKVVVILAQDGTAIKPAVAKSIQNGVPVIAYDRLIEDPRRSTSRSTTCSWASSRRRPCSRPSRRATTS